jgi:hypothetical protein
MRVGGGRIRTCDLRFIKRGSQPIELPLGGRMKAMLVALESLFKGRRHFFMKIFQFQHLLGQNWSSIEGHQFGLGSSVEPRSTEVMLQLHAKTREWFIRVLGIFSHLKIRVLLY